MAMQNKITQLVATTKIKATSDCIRDVKSSVYNIPKSINWMNTFMLIFLRSRTFWPIARIRIDSSTLGKSWSGSSGCEYYFTLYWSPNETKFSWLGVLFYGVSTLPGLFNAELSHFGLVWFYGISTIGYLMANPFLYIWTGLFQKISSTWVSSLHSKIVLFHTIQFIINTLFSFI